MFWLFRIFAPGAIILGGFWVVAQIIQPIVQRQSLRTIAIGFGRGIGGAVLGVVALSFYGLTFGKVAPGQHCFVTKAVYAAQTPEVQHELFDAQQINDTVGIQQIQEKGKLFHIDAGSEALVLDDDFDFIKPFGFRRKVRILSSGDAYGEIVWIDSKALKPFPKNGTVVTTSDGKKWIFINGKWVQHIG
jgi:hypothetical protein